jgi:translation initiation factor IF-2
MSKVRINDLARELEVKSKAILDALADCGVTEKKTHSSSLEADEAVRVRAHFARGGRSAGQSGSRLQNEPKPKIDWSRVSKPGDVLKAIQERKEQETVAAARPIAASVPPKAPVSTSPAPSATPRPAVTAAPPPVAARPAGAQPGSLPAASAAQGADPQRPAPRRIVPQPRQASAVIAPPPSAAPAIAARPPAAPVVAKPPVTAAPAAQQEKHAAPATQATQEVKSPLASGPSVPVAVSPAVVAAAAPAPASAVSTPAPAATSAASASQSAPQEAPAPVAEVPVTAPEKPAAPAPPARRVIMPQTGPRPVYTAPPPSAAPVPPRPSGGGIQRGKPIFDRRPAGNAPGSGPGGYAQRPSGPGGRRPMHPTRNQPGGGPPGTGRPGFNNGPRPGFGQRPGGFGQRPGMGAAPGLVPPPGDTPGRPQRPGAGQKRGGRSNQYPKSKEGPMKGFAPPSRFGGAQIPTEPLPITRTITVTEGISVKDLAEKLGVRGKDLIATLLMRGVFVTVNQSLDGELVKDVARQFGADTQIISFEDQMANEAFENLLSQDNPDELEVSRPPVVTVMGHVDHGKTSLLDAIRETDVAGGEAGGITQHIGAYKVRINKQDSQAFGREIVFLDTPGHEAFTRMRARGAKVTDIVVIVVAADDGVMPQTLEAVDHAKAANVPIIVAVNKIDKPEAQPDRVKKQLGDRGLVPEDWGGSTVFVDVSAKKRQNLDLLLEMICLVADLGNLKATPGRSAVGTVIEAKLDRGRGAVASVLVQNGTLRAQDSFIVGNTFGKIRAMFDDRGRAIEEAGPSTPVEILGLENMPDAGDTFLVVADRDKAKGIAQYRQMKEREVQLAKSSRVSLEGLAEQIKQAGMKELPLILKGDVTGSVEVLADSLQKMSTEKVRIKVIHSGVGAITESDVLLASASNAIIIGFNVKPDRKSADLAEQENVEIRLHTIIYELQEEITKAMLGLLDPVFKESYLGRAEVLNVFKIPKVGTIAGCRVLDGVLRRDSEIRLMRGGEQVFKGKLTSLKRFKDDAKEVTNGMECGVGLNTSDIQVGDTVEAFTMERVAAELTAQ